VNYRYGERKRTPRYHHDGMVVCYGASANGHTPSGTVAAAVRNPYFVYKQVCCYSYQSCEHPDWEHSVAFRYIEALRAALCKSAGRTEEELSEMPTLDVYPWGVDCR
jgi:hypothetical protein